MCIFSLRNAQTERNWVLPWPYCTVKILFFDKDQIIEEGHHNHLSLGTLPPVIYILYVHFSRCRTVKKKDMIMNDFLPEIKSKWQDLLGLVA